jgi:hypothetical protein
VIQDVIIWSSHTFLQDHLALSLNSPGALQHQQAWEQQQQQQQQASKSAAAAAARAHARAPEGAGNGTSSAGRTSADTTGSAMQGQAGFERAQSLMDHLAADENLIQADEQQGNVSNGAATQGGRDMQPPRAHSLDHDQALEQVSQAYRQL